MMTKEQGRILIVEDNAPLARGLKLQLEEKGFQVHTETEGSKAIGFVAEHPVDLVILDLRLPDMNGYEVCKQLHKISQPWVVPILMLTAMKEPVDQLRGFAYGADAYLTKPYEASELLKTISLLLKGVTP